MQLVRSISPFAAAILFSLAASSTAFADCAEVNTGVFDRNAYTPPGSGVLDTSSGFAVGDVITFTVSGLTGSSFELINGALDTALLIQPLSGTSVTLSYTVTGTNSDTDLNTYMLVQAIPYEITIAATCVPGGGGPGETVSSFLASRIDAILLGDPSGTSLRNRVSPVPAAGGGGSDMLTNDPSSPWHVWADGSFSALRDDLDRSNHVGILYAGADYRVADNTILGVLTQFDWAQYNRDVAAKVGGTGWMIGPYLSTRLHDSIFLDLRAAWGKSSNSLTTDTATGSFDTERWLVKGTLSGNWFAGAWRMTPSAELAYMNEHAAAFTDSTSTVIPEQDVSTGRLQLGAEIGYRIGQDSGAVIEPFVGARGVWDFVNPNATAGDIRARVQAGLNVTGVSGLSLRALASWDGVGAPYSGYTLQGTLRVPLN